MSTGRAAPMPEVSCSGEHCITCSDEGIAMRVLSVDPECELAECAAPGGEPETVQVALVGDVAVGQELLVHAGSALARLEAR